MHKTATVIRFRFPADDSPDDSDDSAEEVFDDSINATLTPPQTHMFPPIPASPASPAILAIPERRPHRL
jgi:hypothetical protein